MRILCAFAAICIVGVYSFPIVDTSEETYSVDCAKELNINLTKIKIDDEHSKHDDEYRLYACQVEKRKETPVSQDIKYEEFQQFLKSTDSEGVENPAKLHQDILSNLKECQSKGHNEVDFLKCIKFLEIPYFLIYKSFIAQKDL